MGMKQSQDNPFVFCELGNKFKFMIITTVTFDNCAETCLEKDVNWFMTEFKKCLKIVNGRILKKDLGVDYEQGIQSDGEACYKASGD